MPRTESAVLGGLPFTSTDFCDFRTHGPHMRINDLSAPSGRFVARVSAPVATAGRCPGRGRALPPADNDFASVFAEPTEVGTGSAEAPAAATAVAAAGASAEPVPTSVGSAKTEAKSLSAGGKARPRPGQRPAVATGAETRATNLPEGAERSLILICGPCVRKSQKSVEVKGSPPKTALSVRGTSPPSRLPESARRECSARKPV